MARGTCFVCTHLIVSCAVPIRHFNMSLILTATEALLDGNIEAFRREAPTQAGLGLIAGMQASVFQYVKVAINNVVC